MIKIARVHEKGQSMLCLEYAGYSVQLMLGHSCQFIHFVGERSHVPHNNRLNCWPVPPNLAARPDPGPSTAFLPSHLVGDVGLLGGRQNSGSAEG